MILRTYRIINWAGFPRETIQTIYHIVISQVYNIEILCLCNFRATPTCLRWRPNAKQGRRFLERRPLPLAGTVQVNKSPRVLYLLYATETYCIGVLHIIIVSRKVEKLLLLPALLFTKFSGEETSTLGQDRKLRWIFFS